MEEQLYSPYGDSISCFIHIYILIFISICIVLNPPVLWNACLAFWGDISFSWGYCGYIQHSTAGNRKKKKEAEGVKKGVRQRKKNKLDNVAHL